MSGVYVVKMCGVCDCLCEGTCGDSVHIARRTLTFLLLLCFYSCCIFLECTWLVPLLPVLFRYTLIFTRRPNNDHETPLAVVMWSLNSGLDLHCQLRCIFSSAYLLQPLIPVWTAILAILTCTEKVPSPLHVCFHSSTMNSVYTNLPKSWVQA